MSDVKIITSSKILRVIFWKIFQKILKFNLMMLRMNFDDFKGNLRKSI